MTARGAGSAQARLTPTLAAPPRPRGHSRPALGHEPGQLRSGGAGTAASRGGPAVRPAEAPRFRLPPGSPCSGVGVALSPHDTPAAWQPPCSPAGEGSARAPPLRPRPVKDPPAPRTPETPTSRPLGPTRTRSGGRSSRAAAVGERRRQRPPGPARRPVRVRSALLPQPRAGAAATPGTGPKRGGGGSRAPGVTLSAPARAHPEQPALQGAWAACLQGRQPAC